MPGNDLAVSIIKVLLSPCYQMYSWLPRQTHTLVSKDTNRKYQRLCRNNYERYEYACRKKKMCTVLKMLRGICNCDIHHLKRYDCRKHWLMSPKQFSKQLILIIALVLHQVEVSLKAQYLLYPYFFLTLLGVSKP